MCLSERAAGVCSAEGTHTLVIVEIRNELSRRECGGVKKWNAGQTGRWLLFNSGSGQVWVALVRPLLRPLFLLCSTVSANGGFLPADMDPFGLVLFRSRCD